MYKSIIILISMCFSLTAANDLSDRIIDSKTVMKQNNSIDTYSYNSLLIKESGQLHIANPKKLKSATTIFKVSKDTIINGSITCDDNIHVHLISKNICFDKATISAKCFTALADTITVKQSNLTSSNLNLGSFEITKTLQFDSLSKISSKELNASINLLAKNLTGFGSIKAPLGTVEVSGSKFINIHGIKVDTRHKGMSGTFIIDPADVEITDVQEGDTKLLFSNIEDLLTSGDVYIKADNSITVSFSINNPGAFLLTLDAPTINIDAPITSENLVLTNTSQVEEVIHNAQVTTGSAINVTNLTLNNCEIDFAYVTVTHNLTLAKGEYILPALDNAELFIYVKEKASLIQQNSLNIKGLNIEGSYTCFNNAVLNAKRIDVTDSATFIRLLKETNAASGVSKYLIKDTKGLKYLDTITDSEILSSLYLGNDLTLNASPNLIMQKDTTIDGQGFKLKFAVSDDGFLNVLMNLVLMDAGGAAASDATGAQEIPTTNLFKLVLKDTSITLKNLVIESAPASLIDTIEDGGTFNGSHLAFRGGDAFFVLAQASCGVCNLDYIFAITTKAMRFLGSGTPMITNSYFASLQRNIYAYKADGSMHNITNPLHGASYGFASFSTHATNLKGKSIPLLNFEKDMLGANLDRISTGKNLLNIYFYYQDCTENIVRKAPIYKPNSPFGNMTVIRLQDHYIIFADSDVAYYATIVHADDKEKVHYHVVDKGEYIPELKSDFYLCIHGHLQELTRPKFRFFMDFVTIDSEGVFNLAYPLYVKFIDGCTVKSHYGVAFTNAKNSIITTSDIMYYGGEIEATLITDNFSLMTNATIEFLDTPDTVKFKNLAGVYECKIMGKTRATPSIESYGNLATYSEVVVWQDKLVRFSGDGTGFAINIENANALVFGTNYIDIDSDIAKNTIIIYKGEAETSAAAGAGAEVSSIATTIEGVTYNGLVTQINKHAGDLIIHPSNKKDYFKIKEQSIGRIVLDAEQGHPDIKIINESATKVTTEAGAILAILKQQSP